MPGPHLTHAFLYLGGTRAMGWILGWRFEDLYQFGQRADDIRTIMEGFEQRGAFSGVVAGGIQATC